MIGIGPPAIPATRPRRAYSVALFCAVAVLVGCAGSGPSEPLPVLRQDTSVQSVRKAVVESARRMLGTPYRFGGDSPGRGFDCSGLVVYSYRRAGVEGLPRSAHQLERRAVPISLDELQPGDLLFFRLSGAKTSHVAIYEGNRHFIHAPSSGKRVERIAFDHPYWGPRIDRAGRLLPKGHPFISKPVD